MFKFLGSVAGHIKGYLAMNFQFIGRHWIIVGLGVLAIVTAGVLAARKVEG